MAVLKCKLIKKSLKKKGFQESGGDGRATDHIMFTYYDGSEPTAVWTKLSHGEKEISDSLIGEMASQVRLTNAEFKKLIECTLDEAGYREVLRKKGLI